MKSETRYSVKIKRIKSIMDEELHNTYQSIILIQDMKALGVPIVGNILIQGVKHGTLTIGRDPNDRSMYLYEWHPDEGVPVPADYDSGLDGPILSIEEWRTAHPVDDDEL